MYGIFTLFIGFIFISFFVALVMNSVYLCILSLVFAWFTISLRNLIFKINLLSLFLIISEVALFEHNMQYSVD